MGEVRVRASIGPNNYDLQDVEFVVDTGAFLTILPPSICEQLGLNFPIKHRVVLADSRRSDIDLGIAYIEIDGRQGGILVGKMDAPMPFLGVSALESLGFKVNPVEGTLEPTRPFPETPVF